MAPDSPDYFAEFEGFGALEELMSHAPPSPGPSRPAPIDESELQNSNNKDVTIYEQSLVGSTSSQDSIHNKFPFVPYVSAASDNTEIPPAERGRPRKKIPDNATKTHMEKKPVGRPRDPSKHQPYTGPSRVWTPSGANVTLQTDPSGPVRQRFLSEWAPSAPPVPVLALGQPAAPSTVPDLVPTGPNLAATGPNQASTSPVPVLALGQPAAPSTAPDLVPTGPNLAPTDPNLASTGPDLVPPPGPRIDYVVPDADPNRRIDLSDDMDFSDPLEHMGQGQGQEDSDDEEDNNESSKHPSRPLPLFVKAAFEKFKTQYSDKLYKWAHSGCHKKMASLFSEKKSSLQQKICIMHAFFTGIQITWLRMD
ncbi:hypothetical protein C8R44DRAFT_740667 [Mycena epipterygia]|nr:hypothetical protein C8R44DRAFT_740667 [Mycena epipterygia]